MENWCWGAQALSFCRIVLRPSAHVDSPSSVPQKGDAEANDGGALRLAPSVQVVGVNEFVVS